MTVTNPAQNPPKRRGDIAAYGIFIAAALVPSVAAIVIIVIGNSISDDDSATTAAENAYINQLAQRIDIIERDRQAFIDAGEDMCGMSGDDAAADSRRILVDHALGTYAIQWRVISTAATSHLC